MAITVHKVTGASWAAMKDMDIETLMMAVLAYRGKNMESRLRSKMEEVQANSVMMDKIGQAMNSLTRVLAEFKADAKPTDTVDSQPTLQSQGQTTNPLIKASHDAARATGMAIFVSATDPKDSHGYLQPTHTKAQIDAAFNLLKNKHESLSTLQQADMLTLQSYMGKNNECTEIQTNTLKKFQTSRESVVGNIR